MPPHLFLFVQMDFPWELGPEDGRYLLRARRGRGAGARRSLRNSRRRAAPGGRDAGERERASPARRLVSRGAGARDDAVAGARAEDAPDDDRPGLGLR